MTSVIINLPDDRAAVLQEKAARQGLTLEAWFQKVAAQEAPVHSEPHTGEVLYLGERPAGDENTSEMRGSVVEEMRKLRARLKPDPEGWTTRDYVNYGRR